MINPVDGVVEAWISAMNIVKPVSGLNLRSTIQIPQDFSLPKHKGHLTMKENFKRPTPNLMIYILDLNVRRQLKCVSGSDKSLYFIRMSSLLREFIVCLLCRAFNLGMSRVESGE